MLLQLLKFDIYQKNNKVLVYFDIFYIFATNNSKMVDLK